MEIYLIRHTKPLIAKDVCYGQSDISVDETVFPAAAAALLDQLPLQVDAVYSSPLRRCNALAQFLRYSKYPLLDIVYSGLLKELDFGGWENKRWTDINQADLDKWMNDFVNEAAPNGESFIQLHQRAGEFIRGLSNSGHSCVLIITHAGIVRSMISHLYDFALKDAFSIKCEYGSVIKVQLK